jgi:spore maturation protein CgeB
MSSPKVLISYFFGDDMIPLGASCARSFRSLGWDVACFNSQTESRVDRWLFKHLGRISRALGLKSDWAAGTRFGKVNHKKNRLRALVGEFKPDWVLVIRSHEFVDRALVDELKAGFGVQAVIGWRVDGPMDCPDLLQDASIYDHYFCIHRHGYDPARDGIHHLPAFGVDTQLYKPPAEGTQRHYRHDIVFVGGANPRRQTMVEQLLDLPIALYGGWLRKQNRFNSALRRRVHGKGAWGQDLVALYHESKIVLNISAWDPEEFDGLNLRVFDVPATGAFLLTDYSPELATYYTVGQDIVCFRSVAELREKLHYYLAHAEERDAIARNGYRKSLTLPTVTDRVRTLIDTVKAATVSPAGL